MVAPFHTWEGGDLTRRASGQAASSVLLLHARLPLLPGADAQRQVEHHFLQP